MGKQVDEFILNEWGNFFRIYIENDFELPTRKLYSNYIIITKSDILGAKEAAINDLRKELGMPYDNNKTSDTLDPYLGLRNTQFLKDAVYFESYLDNKDILLYMAKSYLGRPTEDPTPLIKNIFLKGLEDLLEKTDPNFISSLQSYLANSEYVLNDLKKYLGIPDEDNTFDSELSILLKSGYQRLFEMVSSDTLNLPGVQDVLYTMIFKGGLPYFGNVIEVGKEWLYLYVKLSFDPPTASTLTYLKERLNELEWYIVNYNLGDWIYGEQKHAGSETSWN